MWLVGVISTSGMATRRRDGGRFERGFSWIRLSDSHDSRRSASRGTVLMGVRANWRGDSFAAAGGVVR